MSFKLNSIEIWIKFKHLAVVFIVHLQNITWSACLLFPNKLLAKSGPEWASSTNISLKLVLSETNWASNSSENGNGSRERVNWLSTSVFLHSKICSLLTGEKKHHHRILNTHTHTEKDASFTELVIQWGVSRIPPMGRKAVVLSTGTRRYNINVCEQTLFRRISLNKKKKE